MTLLFEPNPLCAAEDAEGGKGLERFLTLLSFTEASPPDCWAPLFAAAGEAIASSGLGHIVLAARFYPTWPGTNKYVDQLR